MKPIRTLLAVLAMALLTGCYTSDTLLFGEGEGQFPFQFEPGEYCQAENRLLPPAVVVEPQISEAMGTNRCRDMIFDEESRDFIDTNSPGTVFRIGVVGTTPLYLLQYQSPGSKLARYLPVAIVDGMVVAYDGQGEWPEQLVAALGLEVTDEVGLADATQEQITALLEQIVTEAAVRMAEDIAFVEDDAGPRLEFRNIDAAYRYIVYYLTDYAGDETAMRTAMEDLANQLDLPRADGPWSSAQPE